LVDWSFRLARKKEAQGFGDFCNCVGARLVAKTSAVGACHVSWVASDA